MPPDLPEVFLLAVTRPEALLILDALGSKRNELPAEQSIGYNSLMHKIYKELGGSGPRLVKS